MPKGISEEHRDVLDRAQALGLDTFGYGVPQARWRRLKERVEAKEAALASETQVGRGDPSRTDDKPLEEPEQGSPATKDRERERVNGAVIQLREQEWRCAYPCGPDGNGGPLLPGEPYARAFDNYSIIHLACAKAGDVPSEGNPWS